MLKDPGQFVYLLQVREPPHSGGWPGASVGPAPWEWVGSLMCCGINPGRAGVVGLSCPFLVSSARDHSSVKVLGTDLPAAECRRGGIDSDKAGDGGSKKCV